MVMWTKEQREAFESRNQNLLLSAAAGSGKTAVLVKRIASLIAEDKVKINEMLIITFTKAAAGEMRERIIDALTELINEEGIDRVFIRKQISMINNSNISTIHGFCMEVIKKNFHKVDVDPSFSILETTENELIFRETIDEILEEEYELGNEMFINFVESYSSNRNDKDLIDIISSVYKFIRSKANPFEWLDEKIELYKIDKDNINDHLWYKEYKNIIKSDLELFKIYLEDAINMSKLPEGPTEYLEALQADLNLVNYLEKEINEDVESFFVSVKNISYTKLKSIKKARKEEVDSELIDSVKRLRDAFKKNLNKLSKNISLKPLELQIEDFNKLYPIMKYLGSIVKKVDKLYFSKKMDRNALDFNDLEQLALSALQNKDVAKKYRNKFKHIFIDEYQDTNVIQEEMINLIKRENNVFLVGDVKQSIYKFRLAEPELFLNKYETYSKKSDALNRRIDLSMNFRSRVEIIDSINYIFKSLMSKEFGEISYDEDAYLYKGIDFPKLSNVTTEINLVVNDKSIIEDGEIDDKILDMKNTELQALQISEKIKNLIGTETYDKKSKKIRVISYSDIVILMRATSGWGPIFEDIFNEQGIPLYFEGGTGYLNTLEIEIFLNLIKIVDNKRNDIALLSVMKSIIGDFSIKEIIEVRISTDKKYYYDALLEKSKEDSKLGEKSKVFIEKIGEWFRKSKYLKIDEFIDLLLDKTQFLNYVTAMPGGNLRRGNLKLLITRAKRFSESSSTGLFNFIKFIENLDKVNSDFDTANVISESENVVRLMSIHKSKGLEFPVVILARGNRQMRSMESKNKFIFHKDFGIGTDFYDFENRMKSDTISRFVINKKIHLENLAEEMRILYVAMTRAVDKLIIFGSVNKGIEKKQDEWNDINSKKFLVNGKSYIDWIMKIKEDTNLFSINIINLKNIMNSAQKTVETEANFKELFLKGKIEKNEEIDEIITFEYSSDIVVNAMKVSVSDLKSISDEATLSEFKLFKNIPQMQKEPGFITIEEGLSPFDIGNAYHYIMEKIDLSKTNKEQIKEQIDILEKKGYITLEEKLVLNVEEIAGFYDSEIGVRLNLAKNIKREIPFTFKQSSDFLIQGIIDLYFEEEDGLVLIDYKTDKINQSNEALLVEEHKKQLEIYAQALSKLLKKPVKEKYLYFFKNKKFICVD